MKLWMKIALGVVIVFFVLVILGNIGKDKESDLSGIDTSIDVAGPDATQPPAAPAPTPSTGNELEDLQQQLNDLQNRINALESEDLGGLSEE